MNPINSEAAGTAIPAASEPSLTRDQENTIMASTTDITPDDPFEPVDLDTRDKQPNPSPELKRWQELAAFDGTVLHKDDVSKLISIPRPLWSDPENDFVTNNILLCNYRSEPAEIALAEMNGINADHEWFFPSTVRVSAKLFGDGRSAVGVTVKKVIKGEFAEFGVTLTVAEAQELTTLLLAAADLAVSE